MKYIRWKKSKFKDETGNRIKTNSRLDNRKCLEVEWSNYQFINPKTVIYNNKTNNIRWD